MCGEPRITNWAVLAPNRHLILKHQLFINNVRTYLWLTLKDIELNLNALAVYCVNPIKLKVIVLKLLNLNTD